MLGPLRTLISVAFLVLLLWAAFTVKLGRLTFADHIDRIGQTPEAVELLDGARSRVRPALDEVKQRVLGEYVEAPTHLAAPTQLAAPTHLAAPTQLAAPLGPSRAPGARAPQPTPAVRRDATLARVPQVDATAASTAEAAKLPGRRKP